jgi:hypothetical protein
MIITKRSMLTGKTHQMDLPTVTTERLADWQNSRRLIQEAFPELNADQREFLISGATPEEWEEAYPPEEDEQ